MEVVRNSQNVSKPIDVSIRLTALWALSESGFGGILHAFRMPFTGVLVGGTAVILITLIAYFDKNPQSILKSTLLVLIVKAIVSPHSPFGAYLAVAFQGIAGWFIYTIARPSLISSTIMAVVCLMESAIQKLITLTLFFGMPLWQAIERWGDWIVNQFSIATDISFVEIVIFTYLGFYFIAALFWGWLAYHLPIWLNYERASFERYSHEVPPFGGHEKSKGFNWRYFSLGIILIIVTTSVFMMSYENEPIKAAILYLLRTFIILFIWHVLLGPWLLQGVQHWLFKKSGQSFEVQILLSWLPYLRKLAWAQYDILSQSKRGWHLYKSWLIWMILTVLFVDIPKQK